MGRWRASASLFFNHITRTLSSNPSLANSLHIPLSSRPSLRLLSPRSFSASPSRVLVYTNDSDYGSLDLCHNHGLVPREEEETTKIPIKAYFLCTRLCGYMFPDWIPVPVIQLSVPIILIHGFGSIDLKRLQAENLSNIVPPTSRSSNYIALRYCDFPPEITALGVKENASSCRYMVVYQYGSAVLFNIEEHDVESYLEVVRKYASGLLPETRKDDYTVKEQPSLVKDMQGGPDYIVLKTLDTDSIRIIASVLGQSIALDHFVSQVDGMVEEFAGINRAMEKTGTFTMDRTKLIQLVGKANSNLADVILKVGLFDRSEIAWRHAKYALIYEYLREEYEVTQRFGNLDFKLKFVEHNIHFLQEVIQNRRSDLLEWCIIFLLSVENIIAIYEIVRDSAGVSL